MIIKNILDEYGLKTGYWEEGLFFQCKGFYKRGEKEGCWEEEIGYVGSSTIEKGKEFINYLQGERNGLCECYDKNNIKIKEEFYKDNKAIGQFRKATTAKGYYLLGNRVGLWEFFDLNKKIVYTIDYKFNGVNIVSYNKDGTIFREAIFIR